MNSRTGSPNHHSRAASRKNLRLRETSEARAKASRSNCATPLAIVTSLKGIGVSPFRMMIQAPHCAKAGLQRLVFVHRMVEFEHRPADRVEQEIADRIADKAAEPPRRACRPRRSARRRRGCARIIGISRMSGGSGKNELSANEIAAITHIA